VSLERGTPLEAPEPIAADPAPSPLASPFSAVLETVMPGPRSDPSAAVGHPIPPRPVGPGKGGPQHRYLQSLIRELGQQQGFRATVEAPVQGGQVDVLLGRDGLRIAFEVSGTTPTEKEQANLRKCLDAGFDRGALVTANSQATCLRFPETVAAGLSAADRERVVSLAPEEAPDFILGLSAPADAAETRVKGYRVNVQRVAVSPDDVKARRDAVARIVARSLSRSPDR
jgi:hypothetical protein